MWTRWEFSKINKIEDYFLKKESFYSSVNDMPIKYKSVITTILNNVISIKNDFFDINSKYFIDEKKIREIKVIENSLLISMQKSSNKNTRITKILNPAIYIFIFKKFFNNPNNPQKSKNNLKIIIDYFSNIDKKINDKIENFTKNEFNFNANKNSWFDNWMNFKNRSISLSSNFKYILKMDISNFYDNIYTHSLTWALCGREEAKKMNGNLIPKNNNYILANEIDKMIRSINENETIGIPQGNKFSDLLAEIILYKIDSDIFECFNLEKLNDIKIIRYRDDYCVFSNDKNLLKKFKINLIEILRKYHLNLNDKKTMLSKTFPVVFWNKKADSIIPKITSIYNTNYLENKEYFLTDIKLFLNDLISLIKNDENRESIKYVLRILSNVFKKNEEIFKEFEKNDENNCEIQHICILLISISIFENRCCSRIVDIIKKYIFKCLSNEKIIEILTSFMLRLKNELDDISYMHYEEIFSYFKIEKFDDSDFKTKFQNQKLWNLKMFTKSEGDIEKIFYEYSVIEDDDYFFYEHDDYFEKINEYFKW